MSKVGIQKRRKIAQKIFYKTALTGVLATILGVGAVYLSDDAHATDMAFTVNVPSTPVLQMTLYDASGNVSDSTSMTVTPAMANAAFNTTSVTVNVGTSNVAGYNLKMYANNGSSVSGVDSTDLISGDNTIKTLDDGEFTCTAEQSATNSTACTFTENRWGYKLSTATNFISVPALDEPAVLSSNDAPTNGVDTTVNFGSRVNAQQAAGAYTTTITFIALANPTAPACNSSATTVAEAVCMQDFYTNPAAIASTMTEEYVYTMYDNRDYQEYTIAKLKDGKVWMTKNLNLAGDTEIESTKSDVPANYTLPMANGFQSGNKLPVSATAGFNDDTKAFVYNTGNNTNSCGSGCYSYYSWTAATAGSGLSITTDNTDAEYSICPKGWKLPNTRTGTNSDANFRALMVAYGGSSTVVTYNNSTNPTGATMYGKIGTGSVPNFLLAGTYYNGSLGNGGEDGFYWSSTSYNSTRSRRLYFNSTLVYSADYRERSYGFAVRCVLAN